MKKREFDEFFLSKVAFQTGYTNVYRNDFGLGSNTEIASPSKWITDDCVVGDFASDNGMERVEKDDGDVFVLEGEELENFLTEYKTELEKAETMTVDELLEQYQAS